MRNELKKYSSIGNKAGILLLCRKLLTGSTENVESARTACSFVSGADLNFTCGLLALEALDLIKLDENLCVGEVLVFQNHSEEDFITRLCHTCFQVLIDSDLVDYDSIRFSERDSCFYIPASAFKLGISVFRNLLITFGALEALGTSFKIAQSYENLFANLIKRRRISQEQLLKSLKAQEELGEAGEMFALEFERNRCPFTDQQLKRIKRISQIDTSAGYDIISYEDQTSPQRRFIEVKTYGKQIIFHWSRNEMEIARLSKSSYYIYLVDASKINTPGYQPSIIQDPYNTVRLSDEWIQEVDSVMFKKIN